MLSRRRFISNTAIGATGIIGSLYAGPGMAFPSSSPSADDPLHDVSSDLLALWGKTLLSMQVKDSSSPHYGTLIYPAENQVHGRSADTIFPFMYLAAHTGNHAYVDASVLLYQWMERTVSQDDGSWFNEPKPGSWKGTTVFTTIALAETLLHYDQLLDTGFKQQIRDRLHKSGDYICNNFSVTYGNINYPVSATYALTLLDELLSVPRYSQKAKALADDALKYFTKNNHLLSGEGGPINTPSPKGCYSVDLGYNVEESLPALVQYAMHTKNEELLEVVCTSMKSHLQFMLPDGGWDNSWGTRNYKWTYWGSRTSDGCQPAYALLAHKDPAFYKAALQNTRLMQQNTHNGILYGGPHEYDHGLTPCLHHTFTHAKALATILEKKYTVPAKKPEKILLPRESAEPITFIEDIQTTLVATDSLRATVTVYDRNYKDFKAGHASGGALTMLWHKKMGVLLCASMNEYQLWEADNMQPDKYHAMPLTPRLEVTYNGVTYTNIQDLNATMHCEKEGNNVVVYTKSVLKDKNQQLPDGVEIAADITYIFSDHGLQIKYQCTKNHLPTKFVLPLISSSNEKMKMINDYSCQVTKPGGKVIITAKSPPRFDIMEYKRIFNYVPGLEAIPFEISGPEGEIHLMTI
ncbi:hypothetical protein [Chitinophaga sp. Cy-1792]|uniref:hypothetical protein n=1 Tax=Chitinophaga sp. Cy-1792 TaxID=2608339 RepID=UPI00141E1389|nr:hypothetical protein [Chitinophaga sp. Cy-1792]NIG53808.1 hypothetical protein [Chitinophaga sp. Cy-1792]